MRSLLLLIFVLPVLMTCRKEEEDIIYNISGIFEDGGTGKPIKGVEWAVYSSGFNGDINAAWNGELVLVVEAHDFGVTEDDGKFEASFSKSSLESEYETVYLGCTKWPSRYKSYIDLHGNFYNLYLDLADYDAFPVGDQRLIVTENQHYVLKMIPK